MKKKIFGIDSSNEAVIICPGCGHSNRLSELMWVGGVAKCLGKNCDWKFKITFEDQEEKGVQEMTETERENRISVEENIKLENKIDDLETLRDKLQEEIKDLNEEVKEVNRKLKDIAGYAKEIKSSIDDINYECK